MSKRKTLPPYYIALFAAVENAIDAMEQMNFGEAKEILICGQQVAEDLYADLQRPICKEEKRQMREAAERAQRRFHEATKRLREDAGESNMEIKEL